jgi:hypothetical protein
MTDTPENEQDQHAENTTSASTARAVSREPVTITRNPTRWVAPLALLVAAIATGLAIWAVLKPAPQTTAGPQLVGDPKQRVCSAFQTVTEAVRLQTHADLGQDPVAVEAVAANARLALYGGGQYLMSRVGSDTPSDLADAARAFATNLEDIGMNALAGLQNSDPAQANRLTEGQNASAKIAGMCK